MTEQNVRQIFHVQPHTDLIELPDDTLVTVSDFIARYEKASNNPTHDELVNMCKDNNYGEAYIAFFDECKQKGWID